MEPEENKDYSLESEPMITPDKKDKDSVKKGPVVLMVVAISCFIVVVAVIILVWVTPEYSPLPTFLTTEPEVEQVEEEFVDVTKVEGRDPDVLGLTVDSILGRYFTDRESGKTLYVNTSGEGCVESCLDDWAPYLASESLEEGGILGTTEMEDGSLQYTWNGLGLYTYNEDAEETLLGDGYNGTWEIARP